MFLKIAANPIIMEIEELWNIYEWEENKKGQRTTSKSTESIEIMTILNSFFSINGEGFEKWKWKKIIDDKTL